VQVACNTPLESSRRRIQLRFRPYLDRRSAQEVMVPQSCGLSTLVILGLPFENPGTKSHSDATLVKRCRVYYMGEGGGFPQVRAVVSLVSPRLPMALPSIKGVLALC
jgi:hypothetical protein